MIEIASGRYAASVNERGGSLATLCCDGRDLIVPQDDGGGAPLYRGNVLAPWPGRVGDGAYEFGGQAHQLPVTEPDRNTALHGLVLDQEWIVVMRSVEMVTLGVSIEPSPGYPFALRLQASYALSEAGLSVMVEAINIDGPPAPYGCGFHAYFLPTGGTVDETALAFSAVERLDVDDRLLPVGRVTVPGTGHDFGAGRPVGSLVLDDAYRGVPRGPDGRARLRFGDLEVWWDESCPWIQLFTPGDRGALAIEPYTCPTDALRTGEDLVTIHPQHAHVTTWGVGVPG